MLELICISTFDNRGKIPGITLNKIYQSKFIIDSKCLIINDKNKPQLIDVINFVKYSSMIKIT